MPCATQPSPTQGYGGVGGGLNVIVCCATSLAQAAVGTISVVYVLCVLQAYILSQTHLHYYEGLYKQRCSQKLVIKSIWRKVCFFTTKCSKT